MIYFTADTHWGHKNIIRYSNRPFRSVEEMNKALIDNINSVVKENDELYHLGDFCFGPNAKYFRDAIKCKNVHIVWGNHDRDTRRQKYLFTTSSELKEIKYGGQSIVLCHYAMRVWNKSHHGAWMIYGHSHNSLPEQDDSLSFDCGVDGHDYKPWSYDEVKIKMATKNFKPIDHHM
jgi:calcineurin-like phosphoesterase family protein